MAPGLVEDEIDHRAGDVRPLRADAARNRARVLEVACETFLRGELSVPLDEIARRAGVGPGTVYRHFPTKDDLLSAVVEERLRRLVEEGRAMWATKPPAETLFSFIWWVVLRRELADRAPPAGPVESGSAVHTVVSGARGEYFKLLDQMLSAAQSSGAARRDISARDVEAILIGCRAIEVFDTKAAPRILEVVFDGLRTESARRRIGVH